jgi:hypothetical protein
MSILPALLRASHGNLERQLSVTVAVGEQGGRPTVSTASCSVSVGNLGLYMLCARDVGPVLTRSCADIDLHGGASWLYGLFVNMFSDQIKSGIQGALHDALVQAINQQAEQALATIPIQEKVRRSDGQARMTP